MANTGISGVVKVTNQPDVVTYRANLKVAVAQTIVPVADPPTWDPNGDNIVELPNSGGATTDFPLSIWLVGQPLGDYFISVQAVDTNGNGGPWATLTFTYAAPGAPVLTLA